MQSSNREDIIQPAKNFFDRLIYANGKEEDKTAYRLRIVKLFLCVLIKKKSFDKLSTNFSDLTSLSWLSAKNRKLLIDNPELIKGCKKQWDEFLNKFVKPAKELGFQNELKPPSIMDVYSYETRVEQAKLRNKARNENPKRTSSVQSETGQPERQPVVTDHTTIPNTEEVIEAPKLSETTYLPSGSISPKKRKITSNNFGTFFNSNTISTSSKSKNVSLLLNNPFFFPTKEEETNPSIYRLRLITFYFKYVLIEKNDLSVLANLTQPDLTIDFNDPNVFRIIEETSKSNYLWYDLLYTFIPNETIESYNLTPPSFKDLASLKPKLTKEELSSISSIKLFGFNPQFLKKRLPPLDQSGVPELKHPIQKANLREPTLSECYSMLLNTGDQNTTNNQNDAPKSKKRSRPSSSKSLNPKPKAKLSQSTLSNNGSMLLNSEIQEQEALDQLIFKAVFRN